MGTLPIPKSYKPVSIDEVMSKPRIFVDLYIQLSEQKYVLIAKAGTNTPAEHLAKYKSKKVQYLWVNADDYATLVAQSISVAGMLVGERKVSDINKLAVIEEAFSAVIKEIGIIGMSPQVLAHAKLVNDATLTMVGGNPSLSGLIEKFGMLKGDQAKHSLMVSLVATMIGVGQNWIKPSTLEKLALGGLLHDIGKLKLPVGIVQKPAAKMTHDDKVIYQSHPEVGRQMVTAVRDIPDDVVLVVYEHHELADGSGFPRGLKDFQTSPLARVVAVANAFASAVSQQEGPINERSAMKALEFIEVQRPNSFNRDAMKALRKLLEADEKQAAG